MNKVNKRFLIVEDSNTYLYVIESLKSKFDGVIVISDYMKKVTELEDYEKENLPVTGYNKSVTPSSNLPFKVRSFNKIAYAKLKDIDLGENNAYFVVGKLSWYFLRDLQTAHIGLRNTNLDWQIVHLTPFSMGSNKFCVCHTMTDEHYKRHMEYFFDDERLLKTVNPLLSHKVIKDFEGIKRALKWSIDQTFGTRFGLDYETNGLWRGDKYEKVKAVGVGLATKSVGFYLDFRYVSSEELLEVKSLYKEFLDKHYSNCWVFNLDFEMLITRKFLGEWAIYDFKDADIWRVIYGDQIGYSKKFVIDRRARGDSPKFKEIYVNRDQRWSLKYTAQKYLNVESWDNEFEWVESKFWVMFNGFQHDNVHDFLMNPIIGSKIHNWVEEGIFTELEMSKILRLLSAWKKMGTFKAVQSCFPEDRVEYAKEFKIVMHGCKSINEVYNHPYYTDVIEKFPEFKSDFDELINREDLFGDPFSIQPAEIVGKYCIYDSYYTVMIAEMHIDLNYFSFDPSDSEKVPASWMTTEKLIDIFNGNKAIGAKLSMYGLDKSNDRRDRYNKLITAARVHSNYVTALAYYQILLNSNELQKHPNENVIHPIFKTVISKGGNPMDFVRSMKIIFPLIYDPNSELGWNEERAEMFLGNDQYELQEILLSHKKKGLENAAAHSRAINLHKELGAYVENLWSQQDLPEDFNWLDIKKYYTDLEKLDKARLILDKLNTSNIKGLHINRVIELDHFEIDGQLYTMVEAIDVLKKQYFDMKSDNEMKLGVLTERWKDYKTLLFLYHPFEYKSLIDDLNIWEEGFTIKQKVDSFLEYMNEVISSYSKQLFNNWIEARTFARENNYPEDLQNPNEEDMVDSLQSRAYLDKMLSHDVYLKHKVTKALMDQYVWYRTITTDDIENRKGWMLDVKHASPMSYKNWMK